MNALAVVFDVLLSLQVTRLKGASSLLESDYYRLDMKNSELF